MNENQSIKIEISTNALLMFLDWYNCLKSESYNRPKDDDRAKQIIEVLAKHGIVDHPNIYSIVRFPV